MLTLVDQPALHHGAVLEFHFIAILSDMIQLLGPIVIELIQDIPMKVIGIPILAVIVHVLARVIGHNVDNDSHSLVVESLHQITKLLTLCTWGSIFLSKTSFDSESMCRTVAPLVVFQMNAVLLHERVMLKRSLPYICRIM